MRQGGARVGEETSQVGAGAHAASGRPGVLLEVAPDGASRPCPCQDQLGQAVPWLLAVLVGLAVLDRVTRALRRGKRRGRAQAAPRRTHDRRRRS